MTDVDITLRLPEELVEKARAQGVLNNKRVAQLLAAEIDRLEGWYALDQSLESARAAFRADHAEMSEGEIIAMIDNVIDEVRAERKAHQDSDEG
jgi:hypothetical protein